MNILINLVAPILRVVKEIFEEENRLKREDSKNKDKDTNET